MPGHVHSITSCLSSLAQYGHLLGSIEAIDRAEAFYNNGAWQLRDTIGWARETLDGDIGRSDRGEVNTTGDLLETALLLRDRDPQHYLDDAEVMIYSHILPTQVTDAHIFSPTPDVTQTRLEGSWGFPAPYGHLPVGAATVDMNTDIVGGVVSSLCAAVEASIEPSGNVNLYLDIERFGVRAYYDAELTPLVSGPHQHKRQPSWSTTEPPKPEQAVLEHPQRRIPYTRQGPFILAMASFDTAFPHFPDP